MNLQPLNGRVVIKINENKERQVGGIILPENSEKHPLTAEVVAVAKPKKDKKAIVEVGDTVIYKKDAGTEVELDEEGTFLIVENEDILAIVEK